LEKLPTTPIGSTFTCGPLSWAGPGRRRCCAEESAGRSEHDSADNNASSRNENRIQDPRWSDFRIQHVAFRNRCRWFEELPAPKGISPTEIRSGLTQNRR
jgi:hypothetical protein